MAKIVKQWKQLRHMHSLNLPPELTHFQASHYVDDADIISISQCMANQDFTAALSIVLTLYHPHS